MLSYVLSCAWIAIEICPLLLHCLCPFSTVTPLSSWSFFGHSLHCVWSFRPPGFLPLLSLLFLCLLPLSQFCLLPPQDSSCISQLKLRRCVCGDLYLSHIPSSRFRTHLINQIKAAFAKKAISKSAQFVSQN